MSVLFRSHSSSQDSPRIVIHVLLIFYQHTASFRVSPIVNVSVLFRSHSSSQDSPSKKTKVEKLEKEDSNTLTGTLTPTKR